MPSILSSQLVLPLPPHLPLASYTAAELRPAVHKAVLRERNLSSFLPRLYSYNHIRWPYAFPSTFTELEESPNPLGEKPEEVIWMHLAHPNGKWLFLVSANNVLRILNLERGTLAWEERFGQAQSNTRVAFAIDFRGDTKARVAMVVLESEHEYDEGEDDSTNDDEERHPVLHVLNITFDVDAAMVKMDPLMERHLDMTVVYLDIAGDHIALIEDCDTGLSQLHGAGSVHLFNWQKNMFVDLPPMLPSATVSVFQDYMFALGVSDTNSMIFQAIAFPIEPSPLTGRQLAASDNSNATEYTMTPQYLLATSIEVPIPKTSTIAFSAAEVCHSYIGPNINTVILWTRVESVPCWSVFTLEADFSKAPREWFSGYRRVDEIDKTEGSWKEIEHKRIWDQYTSERWMVPNLPGRRFIWFWYESYINSGDDELGGDKGDEAGNPKKPFQLWSYVLDRVPAEKATNVPEDFDHQRDAYWDTIYCQKLMVPVDFEMDPETEEVYTVAIDEWSGTVTIILVNGDVWVLRYSSLK